MTSRTNPLTITVPLTPHDSHGHTKGALPTPTPAAIPITNTTDAIHEYETTILGELVAAFEAVVTNIRLNPRGDVELKVVIPFAMRVIGLGLGEVHGVTLDFRVSRKPDDTMPPPFDNSDELGVFDPYVLEGDDAFN